MKNIQKSVLALVISIFAVHAEAFSGGLKLNSVFSDNMVLQQNSEVKMSGYCEPFSEVTVKVTWSVETFSVTSGPDGRWVLPVKTASAGGPYLVEVKSGDLSVILENVMLGEVWFCSGQSNMEMPIKGYPNQPVTNGMEAIFEASPSIPVRIFKVQRTTSRTALSEPVGEWALNTPDAVADISAAAYFFAKRLQSVLDVPVGIIVSAWGGTPIQAWMSPESLSAYPSYDLSYLTDGGPLPNKSHYSPAMLYNAMIAPFAGFPVKGFLWYQGESNKNNPAAYKLLQASFIESLRKLWDNPDMPFYYVQIAPYAYGDADADNAARFREAQMQMLDDIPNIGMVSTIDIGNPDCIHPSAKQQVGDRFAALALHNDYWVRALDPFAPKYESYEIKGNAIFVKFRTGPEGLAPLGKVLTSGFEIAGKDRKFYPAQAKIIRPDGGNVLEITSDKVKVPVAVRYCFRNVAEPSLFNCQGIPAYPFRTDNW